MKHVLLIVMLSFGLTSVAYAQTPSVTAERGVSPKEVKAQNIQKVKDARAEFLTDRKQALEERAEKRTELTNAAQDAKAEFKAQFEAATTTEAKQAIREQAAVAKEEFQATAQEYREDWRERVQEYFEKRIEVTFNRFATHIQKVEQVDARIVSVLDKLEAAGIDTSSVVSSLEQARTSTADAKEAMRIVRSNLESVVEAGTKEEVRAAFNQAKIDIKAASETLKSAYLDIRKSQEESQQVVQVDASVVEKQQEEAAQNPETPEEALVQIEQDLEEVSAEVSDGDLFGLDELDAELIDFTELDEIFNFEL